MTEKVKITAICQECGETFEYMLKPGFPRKYCFACSEKKKASFEATHPAEESNVPVVRPGIVEKVEQKAPAKEFHLSPEQVNTNALDLAIKWKTTLGNGTELMEIAKKFKEFIENGN